MLPEGCIGHIKRKNIHLNIVVQCTFDRYRHVHIYLASRCRLCRHCKIMEELTKQMSLYELTILHNYGLITQFNTSQHDL